VPAAAPEPPRLRSRSAAKRSGRRQPVTHDVSR
jgi:hypothetical protein